MPTEKGLTRREFLMAGAGVLAAGAGIGGVHLAESLAVRAPRFSGRVLGAGSTTGHLLRSGLESFPWATDGPGSDKEPDHVRIAIVGSGMAALTAAWKLRKHGFTGAGDFRLLELEDHIGGNSAWGENAESSYPWGAHYLPLLNEEAAHLVPLLEEFGVIEGRDAAGAPLYNEHYLCFAPQERLFLHGKWREGLEPRLGYLNLQPDGSSTGTAAEEEAQFTDFHNAMETYRLAVGSDGRRAFAIPVDLSSADSQWRDLDKLTMAEFMRQRGWTCTALHWYVNYGCRDDYGTVVEETSAWAGIHYFASRSARIANGDPHLVLTWPEGNGWLAKKLRDSITASSVAATSPGARPIFQTQSLVYKIAQEQGASDPGKSNGFVNRRSSSEKTWRIEYLDVATRTRKVLHAEAVIVAAPHFVAQRIVSLPPTPADSTPLSTPAPASQPAPFTYAPWMVANITMEGAPEGAGSRLAWDNVMYAGDSLGYVMATHQRLERFIPRTVLTYYHPLTAASPVEERTRALARTWEQWRDDILADLSRPHPGIAEKILHMDVWLWGHGMIRPIPGFMWGGSRQAAVQSSIPDLAFAHADYSGISIFEEASWHGMRAADAIASHLANG